MKIFPYIADKSLVFFTTSIAGVVGRSVYEILYTYKMRYEEKQEEDNDYEEEEYQEIE